jgi:tetratricopeptide (TPR) repeat protein
VARPPQPDRTDRFALYGQLIQHALEGNNTDQALEFVDAGEKADCEQNEGRRRNDFELWRGRLHARRGELDQAQDVFDRLIARVPSNLRYRGTAAESMLSARDGSRALRFAEDGLTAARQQKDRDSEQHFMELTEAAKKQGG